MRQTTICAYAMHTWHSRICAHRLFRLELSVIDCVILHFCVQSKWLLLFRQLSIPRGMLAGGLAGMFQIIVTTPMELLKIQMQDQGRTISKENYMNSSMSSLINRAGTEEDVCTRADDEDREGEWSARPLQGSLLDIRTRRHFLCHLLPSLRISRFIGLICWLSEGLQLFCFRARDKRMAQAMPCSTRPSCPVSCQAQLPLSPSLHSMVNSLWILRSLHSHRQQFILSDQNPNADHYEGRTREDLHEHSGRLHENSQVRGT